MEKYTPDFQPPKALPECLPIHERFEVMPPKLCTDVDIDFIKGNAVLTFIYEEAYEKGSGYAVIDRVAIDVSLLKGIIAKLTQINTSLDSDAE